MTTGRCPTCGNRRDEWEMFWFGWLAAGPVRTGTATREIAIMKRETLLRTKSVMHKMDFYPSSQLVHSLVDSHLEALDKIEELARTIERVEGLAAAFDREAARPDNTVAPVARGIAASIRSALRGEL